jgi:hypothetical protein
VDLWKHRRTCTIQRRILTCSLFAPMTCEKEDMNQNRIQSKPTMSFLQFLIEIRTAGPSLLAAVVFGLSASLFPETVHAQEISVVLVAGRLPLLLL